MLFRTNAIGVRRLSLILGLIAGCYFVFTEHTPIFDGANKLYWTLLNMAILFAVGFSTIWLTVRIIAWIVDGFLNDRTT
jgi:hypothetical protein